MQYVFDDEMPPPPKRPNNWKPRQRVEYPFRLMELNSSVRISGLQLSTVRKNLYLYLKSKDAQGKRFVSKTIAPGVVRVWRTR